MSTSTTPSEGKTRLRRALIAAVVCLACAATVGWFFWQRWQQTDSQLQAVSTELRSLAASQAQLAENLKESVAQTRAAQERALTAEQRAGESELVSQEVARQATQAQAARTLAELQAEGAKQEAEAANERAQSARRALEEIRKARMEELNRMQEALSKVAKAHRTANGIVVDLSNESFQFDFDDATIRPENREILSRLAGILLASHGYRLYVFGHTDDIGDDQYNQGLSERRAKAVGDYLIQAGIPAAIVTTRGMGKSSPRVKGTTPAAREQNRRVEVGIVDTVIQYEREPKA